MASETDIANLALVSLLGCNRITNLDDEQTEAIVMKASYDSCRDKVLETRAWTFATKRDIWIPTADEPAFGFTYSFLIPSEVLRILTCFDNARNDNAQSNSTFKWQREGDRIITDALKVNVRYLERTENVNLFSSSFITCLSLYLAWFNCIALTENRALKDSLWAQYQEALDDAAASDGQQGRHEQITSNVLMRVR
jgi:hypothetical protein